MTQYGTKRWLFRFVTIFLVGAFFSSAMGGCATTTPENEPGPGMPDQKQLQDCKLLLSAIQAQSRVDALAALALLQADIARWETNTLQLAKGMIDHAAVTNAVDKEDWQLANLLVEELKSYYGHDCTGIDKKEK